MGSEDRRPLLGESGDEADDIKVEMPDLPHITRPEVVNIPDDILKTFLCAIFMGCGSLATAFSIALVHERYPHFQKLFLSKINLYAGCQTTHPFPILFWTT